MKFSAAANKVDLFLVIFYIGHQMRWSAAGAHYLLQVRVELLNGTLGDQFRRWHERLQGPSRYTPCIA